MRSTQQPVIDVGDCVRAGSAAFTVLLLGGALTRIVTSFVPTSEFWWQPMVAVSGYLLAGSRAGDASRPLLQGASAALVAWILMAIGRLGWGFAGYTPVETFAELLVALPVGAVVGWAAGQRAERLAAQRARRDVERRRTRSADKATRRARQRGARRSVGSGPPGS